jgi:hypothetical protein
MCMLQAGSRAGSTHTLDRRPAGNPLAGVHLMLNWPPQSAKFFMDGSNGCIQAILQGMMQMDDFLIQASITHIPVLCIFTQCLRTHSCAFYMPRVRPISLGLCHHHIRISVSNPHTCPAPSHSSALAMILFRSSASEQTQSQVTRRTYESSARSGWQRYTACSDR